MLLHNCTKFHARDNPEDIQKVYSTPDLIHQEQQHNKALRAQLAKVNKGGKKYVMDKTAGLCRGEGLIPPLCTHALHHTLATTIALSFF